ncbi:MAG: potassium channel family protein [Saprospiraceae bacterium]
MRRITWFARWSLHTVPSTFLSIRIAIALFISELMVGMLGFMLIEHYTVLEAFYMTVITVATVGYTEVRPLDSGGKLFVSIFIMLNIGTFAYILAAFTYYVVEGEIFKNMHSNWISESIARLSNHVILCGYGRYGKEIAAHLQKAKIPFVIIDNNTEEIEGIQKSAAKILYVQDDATHDEALQKAGIQRARALISALPDDINNVYTVLTARQLNKNIMIISRVASPKSEKKLRLAGANEVVMPEQIGGFYMATLISKPGAVGFFSFITNEYESDIGFEEIKYENAPFRCQNKSIEELHLRRETGVNIIGYKNPSGQYIVNPGPETILVPNSSFIVLGDHVQLEKLHQLLKRMRE